MAEGLDVGTLSGRVELHDDMSGALEVLGHKVDALDEKFGGFGQHVAEQATAFFTAEAALDALKEVAHLAAETLSELVIEGSKAADIRDAFDHLTEGAHMYGEELLGAVKDGTKGLIEDTDIFRRVNQNMSAGLNLTTEQYRTLAEGARALAKATGGDAKEALDLVSDAMVTGRTRAVAMLTGKIDLAAAEESYAEKLHTTSDHLSAEGKLEAAREAILNKVATASERLGDQELSLAERIKQVETGWKNFMSDLGESVARSPVLVAGFQAIQKALGDAFGGQQGDAIRAITNGINDGAIAIVGFAEYLVDAVGVIGVEWNAALVVFETVKEGWDAIGYAGEGALLGIMKGLNAISFGAFDEDVKLLQKDVDGWYDAMVSNEQAINQHKKAEDEWAVSTGKVKDSIEGVRQKMIAAQKTTEDHTKATQDLKTAHGEAATKADAQAQAEDHNRLVIGMSKDEIKKYVEAWHDLDSVGETYKDTLATLAPDQVATIKYYLDAGVAVDKLAAAFPNLSKAQIDSVQSMRKDIEDQIKAIDKLSEAWSAMYQESAAVGATDYEKFTAKEEAKYEKLVQTLQEGGVAEEKYYASAWQLYEQDVENYEASQIANDTRSKTHLENQLHQAQETYDRMIDHRNEYKDADIQAAKAEIDNLKNMRDTWGEVGFSIDKDTEKVRTLSGEVLTLKEYEARQLSGGSMQYDLTTAEGVKNFHQLNPSAYVGTSDAQLMAMAKKGVTLQQMIEQGIIDLYAGFKNGGVGGTIPSFANGGSGDFGSGTLAMLHGKEVITPIGSVPGAAGGGGGIQITNYINGTAAETARKVSDEIMRNLKQHRQFGAA